MSQSVKVLEQLEELRKDSKYCKELHFAAAGRKLRYHKLCSVSILVLEVVITGILLHALIEHPTAQWLRIFVAVASLLTVFLTALQLKFGFDAVSEGHRSLANRYLVVSHQCKRLLGKQADLSLSPAELWDQFQEVEAEYNLINRDAQKYPIAKLDDRLAQKSLDQQRTPYKA